MTLALTAASLFLLGWQRAVCLLMALRLGPIVGQMAPIVGQMGPTPGRAAALRASSPLRSATLALAVIHGAVVEPGGIASRVLHEVRSSVVLAPPPQLVSDHLIHRLHHRGLQHFKTETEAAAQSSTTPDTVLVRSGGLNLHALLWKPVGSGPFPAVLFNHGSYGVRDPIKLEQSAALGQTFSSHGYVLLFLFRRGVGLSGDQGPADGDLMARAFASRGQAGRNEVQWQLLEQEEMEEALAGLAFLRQQAEVDAGRIAVAGHSLGGSLSLLLAARDSGVRAVVDFSGSARSWSTSPELRAHLLKAITRSPPVMFLHAANDYSTAPGKELAAEMQRLGRPNRLKIYPAYGRTPYEGHNFLYASVPTWEADVFAFLDRQLGVARPTH